MKRTLFTAVAVLLIVGPLPAAEKATGEEAAPPGKTLEFNTDYPGAVKQAKKEGKAMVVEFETAWCPFCRAMERVTFKDPDVVDAAKDLVLAKVDADTQKVLAKKFKTGDGFPLFVFMDRNQKELFRLDGYHPPDSFKLALQAAADEGSKLTRAVGAAAEEGDQAGGLRQCGAGAGRLPPGGALPGHGGVVGGCRSLQGPAERPLRERAGPVLPAGTGQDLRGLGQGRAGRERGRDARKGASRPSRRKDGAHAHSVAFRGRTATIAGRGTGP
jgi:thioredoxin-related protein